VWTPAGKKVFSSMPSQDGLSVDLDSLSPALREVVRLAGIGGVIRLWLPPDGMAGWEPKSFPPGDLIFEIEVLAEGPADVTDTVTLDAPASAATPTLAPPDLADAPKDARTTRSGLKYVVQRDGTGPHPNRNATSRLSVNAWAKRGLTLEERERNFAVTVTTMSAPAGLGEVLAQLGTDGKARVWVPVSRAEDLFPQHKDQALILDVTLTGFDKE
jgi:FKBP-type peptidyl-prolyl cis-trans isomerase